MTRDEFESRYRLLQEVTREGGATTHNAIGPAGAVVMVHFLQEGLLERVRTVVALPESERPDRIVTLLDVDDVPVLVTKFIMDFTDLERWLEEATPTDEEPPGVDPVGKNEGGGFTDLFETVDPALAGASQGEGETPPPDALPAGEFTALFRAAGGDPLGSEEVSAPPDESSAEPGGGEPAPEDERGDDVAGGAPGEFTRMFGAMDPSGAPPSPQTPIQEARTDPPDDAQGLEDRRPAPPRPPSSIPVPPAPAPPRPIPPPPPSGGHGIPEPRYGVPDDSEAPDPIPAEPGGLTARFATPSPDRPYDEDFGGSSPSWPPVSDEPTPGQTPSEDYLERLHTAGPPSASQSPPHTPSPPPPPPGARGPGAYTRVIAGVQPPSPRPPSGSPPIPPAAGQGGREGEKSDSLVPLLLLIGLIVLLAVGLVVGYVMLSNRAG